MRETRFSIEHIPAVLYGEASDRVYLFVHGKCGHKEEAGDFAEIACPQGFQVLGIDLPGHGARRSEADKFDPWHTVPELQTVMDWARLRWDHVSLRANSIGAWFSMLAFGDMPPERSLFVSPVLDMAGLIGRMMQWAGVTEENLRSRETIETAFGEPLSWRYYQYARERPIEHWTSPTAILYAGQDNLTPRPEVDDFVRRFRCDLTVMEDGVHWFHTPEQLAVLRQWTEVWTAPELTPEECLFFAGRPVEAALYAVFRARLLAAVGPVNIKVQKTQITFAGRHGFAFVSHPRRRKDTGILVSFGLFRRQDSPRIQYASEPYPDRWTHHLPVRTAAEIDEELLGWLREAHWFSEQK